MRLLALVALPVVAAMVCAFVRVPRWRTAIVLFVAVVHAAIVGSIWIDVPAAVLNGWMAVDVLGMLVLSIVSILFLAVACYSVGYLRIETPRGGAAFASCLLAFLAATTLVCLSRHLALLWVGLEATTLAIASTIYHRNDRRSLEAVWKYLVLSSVGIALALLGIFLLATAQPPTAGQPLMLDDLVRHARDLNGPWLRAAVVFLFVGFGTKMGLAPMHTWKPDTYGEAPGLVGALMAGALTSCAFLGLCRVTQVVLAAALIAFLQPVLLVFGITSLVVAAGFIIGQTDVKRMLAYSSVEQMGVLSIAIGLGGSGSYGAMLHLVNNALAKGMLFLVVGNLLLEPGSSPLVADARGLLRRRPVSSVLLVVGLLAVTGSPPFGMFVSEFTIIRAAVEEGHFVVAAAVLGLLAVIFVGIGRIILDLVLGAPPPGDAPPRESLWLVGGPTVLAGIVLMLGLHVPARLHDALASAALQLGGHAP